ncbi:TPA: ATP-binding domain-containing protein [Clostridioides difficile]|uniref:HelD family protein n=1 Tax=Clostridioides difficile TaxID=1496 RepID=UPI00017F54B4|nr:3'-5' exonuclease [Clostridioides difficile]MBJ9768508.1 ATP-binding domain-containing protein [Clostridioides difficile]MCE0688216.1 AAA family ATPase [Clostridioides difficile]MCE0712752.1 AAA family ATPase [Clostridioides difficile]MCE0720054.1 AAA family ATPase [Clostridioides difficile]MCE0729557.1 AAA family ATPase [Clostridioides difficile]
MFEDKQVINCDTIASNSKHNMYEHDTELLTFFPDEIAHLIDINNKLDDAFKKAENLVDKLDKDYMDTKMYMVKNRGEIDPHEMFQNEQGLKQIDNYGAFMVKVRDKIDKIKDSPYFARIDFRLKDMDDESKYYIGRFAFDYEDELIILDWRSPIASMFYDYEIGKAGYDAPIGWVDGEITRKRQFKIKNGKLEYALESSINIQDDILQKELSHTSDEKMKSIISTIQKEQNQIIRNDKAHTLIIQGVAGSGKTSIALHRIAFLLYRFKDKISANNVIILSPNKVFGDYISNVLPELGEEPLCELSFENIAEVQLDRVINFESEKDPLEINDAKWAERVRFKSTFDFVKLIDYYIKQMPNKIFIPKDYNFGSFTAKSDWIQSRFEAYNRYPVKKRLEKVAEDIHYKFESDNIMEEDLPKLKSILKSLNGMLTIKNTLTLYKDFFKQMNLSNMFVMATKKTLEWSDVYPFIYIHAAYEGIQEDKIIRHVVIDEMQDYTPIQYAVINLLFKCKKTILGDFGQLVNPNHTHTLDDMRQLYNEGELVTLNKSYRSTFEIINFAKKVQDVSSLEPIERHGEEPALVKCTNKQDEVSKIKIEIEEFKKSDNATLGIILKTDSDAEVIYNALKQEYSVNLISSESSSFTKGVSITSIKMSKGLEFDEVIIPSVNSKTYYSDYDRSLLYIACTRAMHKLKLTYTGELTQLIDM